jgi:hypothetical protein
MLKRKIASSKANKPRAPTPPLTGKVKPPIEQIIEKNFRN